MRPEPAVRGGVLYQFEALQECIFEIRGMAQAHWEFAGSRKDVREFDPNIELYMQNARNGHITVITAREAGRLIGYLVMHVAKDPHARGTSAAESAFYYVEPRRNRAFVLRNIIRFARDELLKVGIRHQKFHTRVGRINIGLVLRGLGYELDTEVYTLCPR